jgi:hypothetical protein
MDYRRLTSTESFLEQIYGSRNHKLRSNTPTLPPVNHQAPAPKPVAHVDVPEDPELDMTEEEYFLRYIAGEDVDYQGRRESGPEASVSHQGMTFEKRERTFRYRPSTNFTDRRNADHRAQTSQALKVSYKL